MAQLERVRRYRRPPPRCPADSRQRRALSGTGCPGFTFTSLPLRGRCVCRAGGQPPDLPYPGIVARLQPALGVASAELDQLVEELAREEQVAEQLAVDRAALGVDDPPEQREVGVAHEAADAGVVTLVDIAREASDLQAIGRRDEDVGDPSVAPRPAAALADEPAPLRASR